MTFEFEKVCSNLSSSNFPSALENLIFELLIQSLNFKPQPPTLTQPADEEQLAHFVDQF